MILDFALAVLNLQMECGYCTIHEKVIIAGTVEARAERCGASPADIILDEKQYSWMNSRHIRTGSMLKWLDLIHAAVEAGGTRAQWGNSVWAVILSQAIPPAFDHYYLADHDFNGKSKPSWAEGERAERYGEHYFLKLGAHRCPETTPK